MQWQGFGREMVEKGKLRVIENSHPCICEKCDPEGYQKLKEEAKKEMLDEMKTEVKKAYKEQLIVREGATWKEKAKDSVLATRSEAEIKKAVTKELSIDGEFLAESQLALAKVAKARKLKGLA